jgi:hypothetical protein
VSIVQGGRGGYGLDSGMTAMRAGGSRALVPWNGADPAGPQAVIQQDPSARRNQKQPVDLIHSLAGRCNPRAVRPGQKPLAADRASLEVIVNRRCPKECPNHRISAAPRSLHANSPIDQTIIRIA